MKRLFYLLVAAFTVSGGGAPADELGALKGSAGHWAIYHKEHLQFMIFWKEIIRIADKTYAKDAVIDLIKKNIDINKIKYLENAKPYPLDTPTPAVAEFWKDKISSDGFIVTSKATILQEKKTVSSNEKVFFRSPQLDLNGIGFTADFDSKIIKVLQEVNIIIRMKADPKGKAAAKDNVVKTQSDSMIIDMSKELITLIGNIRIDETDFNIFCDRLLIDLKKNKNKNILPQNSGELFNPSGVSQITCLGNVKIIRKTAAAELKKNGSMKAFADQAIYSTVSEEITLLGKNPRIYYGNDMVSGEKIVYWKNSARLQAFKNCLVETLDKRTDTPRIARLNSDSIDYAGNRGVFTGNVLGRYGDYRLNCNQMTFYLKPQGENQPKPKLMKSLIADSGKKELKEVVCTGNVTITRIGKTPGKIEKAVAGQAEYVLRDNKLILSQNQPFIISGRDSVSGRRMVVWLDQNRLKVAQNSKLVLGSRQTTVISDSSDLNYGGDELTFNGRVKVDNPQLDLTCDNMKIFLEAEKKTERNIEPGNSLFSADSKSGKKVDKIVCTGAVRTENPRARVDCDRMVITFKERAAASARPDIGIGGEGSGDVDLIKCFGNVRMTDKPEDAKTRPTVITSDNAILNIPGNIADLVGKVRFEEPRFTLNCAKMKLLAKDITAAQATANEAENKKNTMNTVPTHIGLGKTKELTKIICLDKVVMIRKLPHEVQKACGDKAVYEVSEHKAVLTGINSKPTLQRGPTVMEGEKIILWTDSEKLDIEQGTLKNIIIETL
ncbi:MAG: LptA/OstA family protein [Victivallaceae bacterium]|nr:LptA/OstA family protein [Victivallaceae bacterium]